MSCTCICVRCGKQFEAKRKTAVCLDCHTAVCVVCGKEFELQTPWTQKTCSPTCRGIYRKNSGVAQEVASKAKKTLESKYGVSNPRQLQLFTRSCKYCGKEFKTNEPNQFYCNDVHYGECPVCGTSVVIKDVNIGPQACSEECRQKRIRNTVHEKYGEDFIFQTEYQKSKSKQTCLEKYGVEYYSQTQEFKDKISEFWSEDHPEIQEKTMQTNLLRYGVEYPMQSEEVKSKCASTTNKHYGGFGWASPVLKEQIKQTNLRRYGVENPMQNPEIRSRVEETNWIRYKSKFFKGSTEDLKSTLQDPSKVENFIEFRSSPEIFIQTHFDTKPTLTQISKVVGYDTSTVSFYILKNNLKHLIEYRISTLEVELHNFLSSIVPEDEINVNCRRVITPLELDFYLPKYTLGIECNPTYTHNSSRRTCYDSEDSSVAIPANYHQNKTIECESKGVRLFHIFGYQWSARPEVIKSMILNALGMTPVVYYARNLIVKEVSDADSHNFLDSNHIQGYASGKVRIGLYNSEELVSLMVLSRKRGSMGHSQKDTADDWELVRFCNQIYSRCVGGASKLFKYFLSKYDPDSVVSFSDRSTTTGGLYEALGFKFDSYSGVGYVWVNSNTDAYLTRVACQKRRLPKLFNELDLDIINKTESEIMEEHGYVRVYNSGLIKWIWNHN